MIFSSLYFIRFLVAAGVCAVLTACAPQQAEPEPEPAPAAEVKTEEGQAPSVPETVDVAEAAEGIDSSDEIPDWEKRYQELYTQYAEEFRGPEVADAVKVELKSGGHQSGWVHRITDDKLVLDTGAGLSSFRLEDLSEVSSMANLRSVYARKRAYDQGREEYEAWKLANQELVRATPTPEPTPEPTPTPEPVREEPTGNGAFPFSVEPDGRVPHVENYIRENAAFPDSLRIRTWWPVEPHDRGGYQVRVRYTLKSAGNLGTSHEDMIFFMYANGRIHQRAAVK
ncbi:MAG: hypothetical protein WD708_01440 [Kiritimatiellia bacterium]